MKVRDCFEINPSKNTNKYTDFINYIDTSSVNAGVLEGITYLENDYPSRAQRLVKKGDILYSSVRPNLKHYYLYNDDYEHTVASTGFVLLRNKDEQKYSTKFAKYFLGTGEIVGYLSGIAELSQATFPSFSPKDIAKIDLPEFTVEQQWEIVEKLSAYDSLIELNNKRIKLLEQMAENLYKEWFVRFRFPGYESVEFEKENPKEWILSNEYEMSRPKDWHYGEFSELGRFVRGKNITAAEMIEGNVPVISAGLEPSGYHCMANVIGKSLTISASGANAGFMKYNLCDIWAADCSYYQNDANLWFAYNTLRFLQPVISNLQCGAAQPHVYPKHINRLAIIIPSNVMIRKFCDAVAPMYKRIESILNENKNLTKQRDLLLPRLMSGKLEV